MRELYVKFEGDILMGITTEENGFYYSTKVRFDEPTLDIERIEGYHIAGDSQNRDCLLFSEEKYNDFVKQQKIEESAKEAEKLKEEITEDLVLKAASDEQAYVMRYLYPEWKVGEDYAKGDRFIYKDKFYKTLQDVKGAQVEHTPDKAVSLYVEIADPANEWPEFKKPTGAHNAYSKGDKVTFEGKHYISKIDANTYTPTEYPQGWELVA